MMQKIKHVTIIFWTEAKFSELAIFFKENNPAIRVVMRQTKNHNAY